ncbi:MULTISPECIES: anti-adapter protein IraM [unclassified Raoultella]|uniref:anti-adapter protein IraM n=1 Tax=unclassified Raoultella TaxID=2627600 RepID=UPI00135A67B1|nr:MULTISPECIES: anti-adapter protein IraM [unclassified Raoultella]
MKWTVLNTIICPHSGVAFSSICGLRFLKFIIWYEADILLIPGESMKLYSSKVLIDNKYHFFKVYNIATYSDTQWESLRERPSCPHDFSATTAEVCCYQPHCVIKRCPGSYHRHALC